MAKKKAVAKKVIKKPSPAQPMMPPPAAPMGMGEAIPAPPTGLPLRPPMR